MKIKNILHGLIREKKVTVQYASMSGWMLALIIIALLPILSCAPQITKEHIPPYSYSKALSFTKYTKLGFLITPFKYPGDYESIGIISVIAMPEAKLITTKVERETYAPVSSEEYVVIRNWIVEKIDLEVVIDQLYEQAMTMGADAIVEFKISESTDQHIYGYRGDIPMTVEIAGVELSGYAIKRLGALK